jgi:hypothetical protein
MQRSTCSNHKAVNLSTAERKARLEYTGIGAACCGRHSFYIPSAVVNFMKGESQANIDPLVCNARKMYPGIKGMILCYDVGCQWHKNFLARVDRGTPYLQWDPDFKLTTAVGTFHLEAHIPECFPRYSLHFVKGSGQIDGENMERLWSPINKSAPGMRAMTTSYRRESLDWLLNTSNWHKVIGIGANSTILYDTAPNDLRSSAFFEGGV